MYRLRPDSAIIIVVSVIVSLVILVFVAVSAKAPWSYIGPSVGPLIIALVAVIGTLYAANTGADGAIRAQRVTQDAIDAREARERQEREARVKALFASHIKSVLAVLHFQTQSGGIWEMDEFERRLAPLVLLRDDKAIVLLLRPNAISAVSAALVAIDLGLRTAKHEVELQAGRRDRATYGEGMAAVDDALRSNLKAIFKPSFEAFRVALTTLGDTFTATPSDQKFVGPGIIPETIDLDDLINQTQWDAEFEGLPEGPDIRPPER